MAARLTKPTPCCKALLLSAALLLAAAAAAAPPSPPSGLRECVAAARDAAAMAACERREQTHLRQRIDQLAVNIRARLDTRQRLVFERNIQAWQAFFDSEVALSELSLGQRRDGLGPALRPGAVTRMLEERVRQLREHLHNLTLAQPPDAG